MRSLSFGALLVAAAIMSACGGGSSSSGVTPDAQQQQRKLVSETSSSSSRAMSAPEKRRHPNKGELKIELRIPRDKKKHHKFRPGYISASTESMTVAVSGQATQVFDLTPSSPGCSSASGFTTCDVSAFFPSGQQTITVSLYDQTGGQGNLLSTSTTSANIVAGSITYISVTLEGVVASATVLVNGSTTVSIPAGVATAFPLTVTAYDADGHIIVAPGGYDTTTPVALSDSNTTSTSVSPANISGPGTTATFSYTGGSLTSAVITAKVDGVAQANPVTVTLAATPTPSPTPSPTPTPMPQVSPASLSFSSGATQTFSVQENNYSGSLSASSANAQVATVSPGSGNGPNAVFTVQPIAGGKTTITVTDSLGNTATVNVSVNGGVIVIDQVPSANPTSLTFDTAAAQTFNVSETEYYGAFTESDNCSGIASTSPTSANGPSAAFSVTPVDGGKCTVTISDAQGNTTGVGISVSAGNITINGKHGKSPVRGGK